MVEFSKASTLQVSKIGRSQGLRDIELSRRVEVTRARDPAYIINCNKDKQSPPRAFGVDSHLLIVDDDEHLAKWLANPIN